MSKSIYEEALEELKDATTDLKDLEIIHSYDVIKIEKALKLGKLYKEFFDKLNIQLRNTFDIDYIYPHEFIIGYDIKSEDKELVKLFKQIKELENDK